MSIKKSNTKRLITLIREMIPVIAGILIALLINNWNENRKNKHYLRQIFSSIEKELEESKADIKSVIPKQFAFIDSLDIYMKNTNVSVYEIILKSDGIYAPRIKTNSWNAISNSKIELIPYDKLSKFVDIEERKKNLQKRTEKQLDFMYQNFESTAQRKKEIIRFMTLDIINAEKRLQSKIEELLNTTFTK